MLYLAFCFTYLLPFLMNFNKAIFSLAFLYFFTSTLIIAQCPFIATLRTQEDVDEFVANYPNCTDFVGNFTLGYMFSSDPESDINDLSGLTQLQTIDGDLGIGKLNMLEYLDGLDNITEVTGALEIRRNANLRSLRNFSQLTFVGDHLEIKIHDSLETLIHLENIEFVGGNVDIGFNRNLQEFGSLNKLDAVNRNLTIRESPLLTKLNALSNIQVFRGQLAIDDTGLMDIDELSQLDTVDGLFSFLSLNDNPNLTSIAGLQNLDFINGSLFLDESPLVSSLTPLSNLKSINNIRVDNFGMTDLNGLQNCKIGGFIWIKENELLESLDGLMAPDTVQDYIRIENNDVLENVDALYNVQMVVDDLQVRFNSQLADCDGICPLLSTGTVGEDIFISNNLMGCNSVGDIIDGECIVSTTDRDQTSSFEFELMPNPAQDHINLSILSDWNINYQWQIITPAGSIVSESKSNAVASSQNINVADLPNGLYYLRLQSNQFQTQRNFLIIR